MEEKEKKMKKFSTLENVVMKIWEKGSNDSIWYETNLKNNQMEKNNYYIRLYFKDNGYKTNGDNILIKNGFWTFYQDQYGNYKPKIVIMSFDRLGEQALEDDVFKDEMFNEIEEETNDIDDRPF